MVQVCSNRFAGTLGELKEQCPFTWQDEGANIGSSGEALVAESIAQRL
jgi:hypothetical protein